MRILLVRPPRIRKAITIGEFMFCEPIGLEALYAVLKKDHRVKILDMMIEKTDIIDECIEWRPDVVGLTSLCVDVKNVLAIARQIKAQDSRIVTMVGGTQTFVEPSAFHDDSIDHVVKYTTTGNLQELIGHLSKGEAVPPIDGVESRENGFESTGVEGRNEYMVPDITSTAHYRKHYSYFGYRPCAIMQTSQGCSKQCGFCLRWRIEGGKEQPQGMAVVFDQVRRIEESNIMIFDNDFLCDGARLNELCELLEANGVKKTFLCYGSVNGILKNREAVARFAKNGLSAVLVGYESFSAAELEHYRKKSTADDNLEAAAFLKEIKVDAWASFIMHPDWSRDDFRKFRRYIRKLRPEISSMTPLTPFPVLPLYKEFADRLIVKRDEYEKWNFGTVSIMPACMSLRLYYLEILLSNLYVNLFMNNTIYLVRKFGVTTLVRLLGGSVRLMNRYVLLMLRG
ncbi:MAG: cobalamin-dependent protein [Kiritimatiellia bacterium]|jgi:radical SAM superfamily enzyme YgiQ (UPF0313 family)|nr:cobalamin-dependent protein [Kiritimatiellia bacterium]